MLGAGECKHVLTVVCVFGGVIEEILVWVDNVCREGVRGVRVN